MNLEAEKIELIKLIADTESERIIKKIRDIFVARKKDENIDFPPEHLLVRTGMLISEHTLSETWKNENDNEWAQYLKD